LISPSPPIAKPEQKLLTLWNRYGGTAIGRKFFNWKISRTAPYSGSINAQVISIKKDFSLVSMKDRRPIRNHLNSIHAIALTNLGELASGLAMLGVLIAEGIAAPPETIVDPLESIAIATIRDNSGDTVSVVRVTWLLSPKKETGDLRTY